MNKSFGKTEEFKKRYSHLPRSFPLLTHSLLKPIHSNIVLSHMIISIQVFKDNIIQENVVMAIPTVMMVQMKAIVPIER